MKRHADNSSACARVKSEEDNVNDAHVFFFEPRRGDNSALSQMPIQYTCVVPMSNTIGAFDRAHNHKQKYPKIVMDPKITKCTEVFGKDGGKSSNTSLS